MRDVQFSRFLQFGSFSFLSFRQGINEFDGILEHARLALISSFHEFKYFDTQLHKIISFKN